MKAIAEETITLDHLNLHLVPSKKYKTITLVAKFNAPLRREDITKRVLLPAILRQGTKHYQTRDAVQFKLDDLYGASLSLDSGKAGSNHVLSVRMEIANQKYIGDESSIMAAALDMLNEVMFHPYVEDQGFRPELVAREKESLQQQISAIIDNKGQYAQQRLVDEMCAGEAYQIHSHGYEADLADITPENLYAYYQTLIAEDALDLYILGDFDHAIVTEQVTRAIVRPVERTADERHIAAPEIITEVADVKEIVEYQDVAQARLNLGYRTGITYDDDDYAALLIFNGLFGGYPGSKLFMNVREKHSLAYSVGSGAESYNGLLFVMSGVASEDYEQAREIINVQLRAMQTGDFTEDAVAEYQALLISQLLSMMDSAHGLIELLYRNVVGGRDRSVDVLMEEIRNVSKADVVAAANRVLLDTVYLLTSKEETA